MISKIRFNMVAVLILAFGVFAGAALAQDTTTTTPNTNKVEKSDKFQRRGGKMRRGGMGFGGRMHRGGPLGMLRGIELSDAQKAQVKTILESNKPDQATIDQMKSLREVRKNGGQLTAEQKEQLKAARQAQAAKMKGVHEQILNVLTADQKQQLQQRRLEMQQRRQEMQQRRQERKNLRQQNKPATDGTATKPIDG